MKWRYKQTRDWVTDEVVPFLLNRRPYDWAVDGE